MSLTNPNSVVTEERLSDFYQGILPYLGGMPDILANKFDKANMFSTDEKIVGQWVDGKPLYQKTITINNIPATASTEHVATKAHGISNLNAVVNIGGVWKYTNGSTVQFGDLSCVNSSNIMFVLQVDTTNVTLRVKKFDGSSFQVSGTTATVTIQYTKSTDSAVAIGIDTDYSTTEKIVGTWIDGRPIYQKTIDCGAGPNNTTKIINHNVENMDISINAFAICADSSGNMDIIPNANTTTYLSGMYVNRTSIGISSNWNMSARTCFATIQYIKTL